jgi:hypothetical protein
MALEIGKETVGSFVNGHAVVGIERTPLGVNHLLLKGVLVRAPGTNDPVPNTAPIWIGGLNVTADSSPTGGIPIPPGESMFIPIADLSTLFVVSTAENQDIAWMGM